MYKIVEFSHHLIQNFYNYNSHRHLTFIDATCGNGHDSLFMANLLKPTDELICYDIQEIAINNTKNCLAQSNFKNITYHLGSHEVLIEPHFDLIIYNLGYLPNGDKSLTTKTSSSLKSIQNALEILNKSHDNCLIIIVLYPGHPEGFKESMAIDNFCYQLNSKNYLVCKYQNYNRPSAPYILTISKNILKNT